jgi:CheY-like chemotaxis protein
VLRNDDDVVRFEIHDTGQGIPLDVQSRMFEPYFTTKPRYKGTGLGLPVCRSIVSAMGGELQLIRTQGQGASFRVLLPATDKRGPRPSQSQTSNGKRMPRRAKVLVVDDEPHVRRLVESALRNCEVISVESAHDALVANDNTDFDLQLYDIMMPTMSGIELYSEIERRYPSRLHSIYFMTGGVSTAAKHDELVDLTDRVLPKPLDIGALRRLVRAHASVSLNERVSNPRVH